MTVDDFDDDFWKPHGDDLSRRCNFEVCLQRDGSDFLLRLFGDTESRVQVHRKVASAFGSALWQRVRKSAREKMLELQACEILQGSSTALARRAGSGTQRICRTRAGLFQSIAD